MVLAALLVGDSVTVTSAAPESASTHTQYCWFGREGFATTRYTCKHSLAWHVVNFLLS